MHYHVLENTPGYTPDETPFRVEDRSAAQSAVAEELEYATADGWDVAGLDLCDEDCDTVCLVKHGNVYDVSLSDDGLSAFIHDRTKTYDLGRVIYASSCDGTDCESDEA